MNSKGLALGAVLGGAALAAAAGQSRAGDGWPLPLAAAAGGLLLLVVAGRGRRVLGVLLALAGAAVVATAGWSEGLDAPTVLVGLGGLAVALGGVLAMITGHRWPVRPARYARTDDESDLWRAQDAGLDPTADPAPGDPDVHIDDSAVTMERDQSQQSRRE